MYNIMLKSLQMVVLLLVGLTCTMGVINQCQAQQLKINDEQFISMRDKKKDTDGSKEQQEAIDAILKLGGTFFFDYQRPKPEKPNFFDPMALNKNPEKFHPVVMVDLNKTKVTDDDLKLLLKLPHLENLDLNDTGITGAGMAHVKTLKKLQILSLWKTKMDDKGLEQIKGLSKMRQLILDETKVTDAGLKYLSGMTELEDWLGLTGNKVTDEGLKHLEGLTKLRSLTLDNTQVTLLGVTKLRTALPDTDIHAPKAR